MTAEEIPDSTSTVNRRFGRVEVLDISRTVALLGMVVFHFVYDLEFFGYIARGTVYSGLWPVLAKTVAGSFLFLAGVSLYLAHGQRIRWHPYFRRLAIIAAAAGLVTIGTYIAMPNAFVYFGILHSIAFASLMGLLFLRLPILLTLAIAVGILVAPKWMASDIFNHPWLTWIGLSTEVPRSVDFEPVFPWLAPCLIGIAVAKFAQRHGIWQKLAKIEIQQPMLSRLLVRPGQHSLVIYLVHQPILIATLWAVTWMTH